MQFVNVDAGLLKILNDIRPEDEEESTKIKYPPQAFLDLAFETENGEKRRVFTADNIAELYDLHFMMEKRGVEATFLWLQNDILPQKRQLYEQGKKELFSLVIFQSPLLDPQKEREAKFLSLQKDEGSLTDTRQCPKCDAPKVRQRNVQDRRIDEGSSAVYTCPKCSYGWKESA